MKMQKNVTGGKNYMSATFAVSLTADSAALRAFSRMSPIQQDAVVSRARWLKTQEEMNELLHGLAR